jgi:ubiquilin
LSGRQKATLVRTPHQTHHKEAHLQYPPTLLRAPETVRWLASLVLAMPDFTASQILQCLAQTAVYVLEIDGGYANNAQMMPPVSPDQMERMLENPMFASQLTEFMNSPQALQLMEPFFAQNPGLREIMRNPEMRRLLFSPESIRTQMQLQRAMGGNPFGAMGGGGSFPAPGVTDNNTAASQPPAAGAGAGATPNPSQGAQANNPFAALFPGGAAGTQPPPAGGPNLALLEQMLQRGPGSPAPAGTAGGNTAAGNVPVDADRDNLLRMLSAMQPQGGAGPNFADLFGATAAPAASDNRPPEERYEQQLRQLNDMGFFDFERNVQALRRSGGSVQGAIEHLLSNP